jgi:REP element-mobilizing transposase RayT
MPEHLGWSTSGRLPHFDSGETAQFITFGLADAIPKGDRFDGADEKLDQGRGECLLSVPWIAELVVVALQHFHRSRYELHAYAVMPNHVHVLITQREGHRLGDIVKSWKSYTSRQANKTLGRSGELWRRDYFDRYIRNDCHFGAVLNYIHENPVRAGLVRKATDWKWPSASQVLFL